MDKQKLIFGLPIILLLILSYLVIQLYNIQQNLNEAQTIRYKSYIIADEMRQSSRDLTRLARTYVATGNPVYEKQYWEILDWRNGNIPRPNNFMLYPGVKIQQTEIMRELGFTEAEFRQLQIATDNSDGLVETETIAMNAIKGLQLDGKTAYDRDEPANEFALRLMFDEQYHKYVENIMAPVNRFFELLDDRTSKSTQNLIIKSDLYLKIIFLNIILLLFAIIFSIVISK